MAGEGRMAGSAETSKWESSRRVQEGQVYICRWGGRDVVCGLKGGKSSSL